MPTIAQDRGAFPGREQVYTPPASNAPIHAYEQSEFGWQTGSRVATVRHSATQSAGDGSPIKADVTDIGANAPEPAHAADRHEIVFSDEEFETYMVRGPSHAASRCIH